MVGNFSKMLTKLYLLDLKTKQRGPWARAASQSSYVSLVHRVRLSDLALTTLVTKVQSSLGFVIPYVANPTHDEFVDLGPLLRTTSR